MPVPDGTPADPPHDPPAERALLGAMLGSKDTIADVIDAVHGADFYQPAHETIFDVILGLYGRDEPVDVVVVCADLTRQGLLKSVGGAEYVSSLAIAGNGPADLADCIQRVAGSAVLRRLMAAGFRISALASVAPAQEADEAVNAAVKEVTAVARPVLADGALPLADIMEETLDAIEAMSNRGNKMFGLPTGFDDLDVLTNGLRPGELIVIAGRPGMGKSVLAQDLLRSCSLRNGLASALFTLESGRHEVTTRLLSAEARVALHHIRSGTMTDDDWARLSRRMGEVSAAPLFIQDTDNLTFTQIQAQCRKLREQYDLRLAIIDTINLLTYGTRPFDTRYLEVSEISRCLKQLAKELQIPVVAVAQLNRVLEQRTDKRPMLNDLRDSGTLEENADMVILLHREDAYDRESPRAGEADFIIAKNRNGPTCMITTAFQGHYSRFVNLKLD